MKRDRDELTQQGPVERRSSPLSPLGDQDHTLVSSDPLVGTTIADFRVLKKLGTGGMGVVYEGLAKSGQRVAIKVLKPEFALDADYVKQLMNEARAVASLKHPGIVEVLSVGKLSSGRPYLVMEYLAGQSVEEWAAEHSPLPVDAVRSLGAQICSILGAVHAQGIVHRDLKGDNMVWVIPIQGPPRVKLLDFGVAKINEPGAMMQTESTKMVGTPAVMSPEQIRAEAITPRTDLYSLGAVLYKLLTGVYPFESPSMAEVLMKHLNEAPVDPRKLRPDVPEPLARLVLALLAKDPALRPESALVVERALTDGALAAPDGEINDVPTSMMPVEESTVAIIPATVPLEEPARPNPFSDLDQGQSDVAFVSKTQNTAPPAMVDPLAEDGPVPRMPGPMAPPESGVSRDTLDEPDASPPTQPKKISRSTDRMPAQRFEPKVLLWGIPSLVGLAGVAGVLALASSPWQSSLPAGTVVEAVPTKPVAVVAPVAPPPPPPVVAPVAPPVVVKPVAKAITSKQLLARADALKAGMKKRHSKNAKAAAELKKLRRRAEVATDDAGLAAVATELDAWEKEFGAK